MNKVLYENKQLKLKSDSILSQLAEINTKTIKTLEPNIISTNVVLKSQQDQLPQIINFMMFQPLLHPFLLDKIKKVEINKKIPILHTNVIYKIISYDSNTKYITCSRDKTIIIRNCEDNTLIKTLIHHKKAVCDILLLSNGRLATASQDKKIKIWNLTNGKCEKTLIGHSGYVYCLLELSNSILLSGSKDSSIGIWDISQQNNKKLQFYNQVKNDKQSFGYCMSLIDSNLLAVSSYQNINIYLFDNITHKSFNIIKTLKGHIDWVFDIKLIKNSKDFLISCSQDKDVRVWSISHEICLKIFKGHSDRVNSIEVLSEKIFVSAGAEIIFWNIDSPQVIHSIKPDQSEDRITSLIKNDANELVFAGVHDFIGFIKI